MNRLPITTALLIAAATANAASLPAFEVTCPGELGVSAVAGGPVRINDKQATLSKFSEQYYEARGEDVTISISLNADGSTAVSYAGKQGANGICQAKEQEPEQPESGQEPEPAQSEG